MMLSGMRGKQKGLCKNEIKSKKTFMKNEQGAAFQYRLYQIEKIYYLCI